MLLENLIQKGSMVADLLNFDFHQKKYENKMNFAIWLSICYKGT